MTFCMRYTRCPRSTPVALANLDRKVPKIRNFLPPPPRACGQVAAGLDAGRRTPYSVSLSPLEALSGFARLRAGFSRTSVPVLRGGVRGGTTQLFFLPQKVS